MIEIPDPTSVGRVADWVELNIAVIGDSVSRTELSAAIERSTGDEPRESFIGDVWRELSNRERMYCYEAFEVTPLSIDPIVGFKPRLEYLTCLILSLYGVHDTASPKLFERITCKAVQIYLSGEAFVLGWPIPPGTTMEERFKTIANNLNERFAESPPTRYKDRGVDIIGWKAFQENRSGQVILLLQCAAGQNWEGKVPVPLDAWYQYIHWAFNPIAGFAIPAVISQRDWHDKLKDKGLMLDRVRITNLLADVTYSKELNDDLNTWVTNQLASFS